MCRCLKLGETNPTLETTLCILLRLLIKCMLWPQLGSDFAALGRVGQDFILWTIPLNSVMFCTWSNFIRKGGEIPPPKKNSELTPSQDKGKDLWIKPLCRLPARPNRASSMQQTCSRAFTCLYWKVMKRCCFATQHPQDLGISHRPQGEKKAICSNLRINCPWREALCCCEQPQIH